MSIRPVAGYHGPDAVRDRSIGHVATHARPAGAGMPFIGDVRCAANDGQCTAPRAKGTDYCIGHLRSMNAAYYGKNNPILPSGGDGEQG